MLYLKFAPSSIDMEEEQCCEFCGFVAVGGFKSYSEGRKNIISCTPCFYTKHACSAPEQDFSLVWLPEVAQTDLVNLSRVISMVIYQNKDKMGEFSSTKTSKLFNNSLELLKMIRLRVNSTQERIKSIARVSSNLLSEHHVLNTDNLPVLVLNDLLEHHSSSARNRLLSGMRLLPKRFDLKQIDEWINSNSSLSGYGIDTIINSDWFISSSGLNKNHINRLKGKK